MSKTRTQMIEAYDKIGRILQKELVKHWENGGAQGDAYSEALSYFLEVTIPDELEFWGDEANEIDETNS